MICFKWNLEVKTFQYFQWHSKIFPGASGAMLKPWQYGHLIFLHSSWSLYGPKGQGISKLPPTQSLVIHSLFLNSLSVAHLSMLKLNYHLKYNLRLSKRGHIFYLLIFYGKIVFFLLLNYFISFRGFTEGSVGYSLQESYNHVCFTNHFYSATGSWKPYE